MALDRRTQILLDDRRHAQLRQRSTASGRSVGDLIREAIDRMLADDAETEQAAKGARERALESFLGAAAMPVADWDELEAEIEDGYARDVAGE